MESTDVPHIHAIIKSDENMATMAAIKVPHDDQGLDDTLGVNYYELDSGDVADPNALIPVKIDSDVEHTIIWHPTSFALMFAGENVPGYPCSNCKLDKSANNIVVQMMPAGDFLCSCWDCCKALRYFSGNHCSRGHECCIKYRFVNQFKGYAKMCSACDQFEYNERRGWYNRKSKKFSKSNATQEAW